MTKILIGKFLPVGGSCPVIKDVLHLTYIHNFGAAFGILNKKTVFFVFMSGFAIILIVTMFFCAKKTKVIKNLTVKAALAMILAGAIGNLIDRIRFRYVIDFIDIRIWPVFNVADTFITIGAFLLIYDLVRR